MAATDVTNFSADVEGLTIPVLVDADVTIVHGSGIVTPASLPVVLKNNTMYPFAQYNGNWYMS